MFNNKQVFMLEVLILLLAKLSTIHGQSDNLTNATQANSSTETVTRSPHRTTMSYTFIARPNATGAGETPDPGSFPQPKQRYNTSILESRYRYYEAQLLKNGSLQTLKQSTECSLRQNLEQNLLDYDAPVDGRYCGSYFDTIICWPASPPGIVSLPCPELLNGVHYDTSFNATRYCEIDGTWGNKSNYSLCSAKYIPQVSAHDVTLQILVYIGYSLSFTTLVGAFCIFLFFRSLRCVRNYIHWNLVSSFVLLYIAYFSTNAVFKSQKARPELTWLCRVCMSVMLYIVMTNFFWMFVEGVYLYTLVVKALTVRRNRFWIYCLFGWGVPVPFVVAFAITEKTTSTELDCWVKLHKHSYIVMVPIFTVIVFNLYFLIHIVGILITKLRASHSLETQQYRKGVKGTLLLLPLLGVTYLLFLLGPVQVENSPKSASTYLYDYFNTILSSMQGFFVAVIYVYLNQDVQNVINRKIRRWREESTLPTRVASRRGSNTRTSFGNLGLFGGRRSVQSGTAGGNGEHVTAFKLPGGKTSPDAYSNGSKVPPFIRLDEVQPLTPVSDAPTSPHSLYTSHGAGNGNNAEEQPGNQSKEATDDTQLGKGQTDCKELPLLSVNACGSVQSLSAVPNEPGSETSSALEEKLLQGGLDNVIPNGNHNNNNSLTTCLAKSRRSPSPLAGRSRVTFADDLVLENHKRPVCCDPSRSPDIYGRNSPTRRLDSERHPTRGHSDGEDSPDAASGKKDPQRSPLLPCLRKKPWASSKPNGTIAFQKGPDGTPV